jgi:translation initiation factor 3 subunit G
MSSSTTAPPMNWGDVSEEEDDTPLPPNEEYGPDDKGIKTIVEYRRDPDLGKIKVIRKVKITTRTRKVPKSVVERTKWQPFGRELISKEEAQAIVSKDEIRIEDPNDDGADQRAQDDLLSRIRDKFIQSQLERELESRGLKGKGGHYNPDLEASSRLRDDGNNNTSTTTDASSKYVPPSMRNTAASAAASSSNSTSNGAPDYANSTTLRVNNISEDATENDLKELFRSFGPVSRIYLAKDRDTGASRGFAYVTFHSRSDAERAYDKLQGYGYDHLILRLEWAKPDLPEKSMDSSRKFTSGYGKALPQG